MPTFTYKAKQGPHKIVDGNIEAENMDKAVRKIIGKGMTPIDVVVAASRQSGQGQGKTSARNVSKKNKGKGTVKKKEAAFTLFKKINPMEVSFFTRQMSDLVDASVPILRALQIISRQIKNVQLQEVVTGMYHAVKDGGSFSAALAQYPDVFSALYVNMVKTGEIGGHLEKVLDRLANYLEKDQATRSKVRSSLAYPCLILIVGVLTVFVLLTFVIPRLTVMFDDLDQSLPWPTLVLMNVSSFFSQYWWLLIGVMVGGGVYLKGWLSSDQGRVWLDGFALRIPVLGNFLCIVEVGRFSRTLGTLVENGVAISTGLNTVWLTIENRILREEIKRVAKEVSGGESLKKSLTQCSFFPEMAVNMISVGEETGHLERGLYKIADTYERESDLTVKTLISLLGPLVLVVIVAMVGFVVIAMLMPIFQMNLMVE